MSDPTSATQGWEQRIKTALDPGRYVSKRACFGFVNDLEQVAGDLTGLVATDPASAVTVYETFVAGCTEKADEVDDSSGEFGSFVVSLVSGWVIARQAAGARPDRTASRLLAWMDPAPAGPPPHRQRGTGPAGAEPPAAAPAVPHRRGPKTRGRGRPRVGPLERSRPRSQPPPHDRGSTRHRPEASTPRSRAQRASTTATQTWQVCYESVSEGGLEPPCPCGH